MGFSGEIGPAAAKRKNYGMTPLKARCMANGYRGGNTVGADVIGKGIGIAPGLPVTKALVHYSVVWLRTVGCCTAEAVPGFFLQLNVFHIHVWRSTCYADRCGFFAAVRSVKKPLEANF